MTRLRLLLVCEHPLPSTSRAGRPDYSLRILSELGNDLTVICPKPESIGDGEIGLARFEYLNAPFEQFSPTSRLRLFRQFRQKLRSILGQDEFDLVRAINIVPTYCALSISDRPAVYAELTDFISDLYVQFDMPLRRLVPPLLTIMEWQIANTVDYANVETSVGRKFWCQLGLEAVRVARIPNGVDIRHFNPDRPFQDGLKERLGIEDGEAVLLYHGDIGKHDGVAQLISSVPFVLRKRECHLLVVGEGPTAYMEYLRKRANENGIENRVTFTGWVDYPRLPKYLALADVGVVPLIPQTRMSQANFHTRIREYVCMRKPFVVTRTPGLLESIGDLGYYIDNPMDIEKLAETINKAIDTGVGSSDKRKMKALASQLDWRNLITRDFEFMKAIVNGTVGDAARFDASLTA